MDYTVNNIYQGGYSSFSPKYGNVFTGYRVNPSSLGMTTDPRTANVIQDASTKLNAGVKQIELSLVSPEVFDAVPKQQLKEINRLSKLTGVSVSVHGPIVEATGISQQGFSELNREGAERKISEALIRSHEVSPDENIPVTFHSAEGIPGSEWRTLTGKEGEERIAKRMIAVDRDSGKMIPLEEEKKYYPGTDLSKPKIYSPEESLEMANATEWDNKISQLFFNKERADEILEQNQPLLQDLSEYIQEKRKRGEDPMEGLTPKLRTAYIKAKDAENYLGEIRKNANSIFSKAYEFGTEEQKKQLKKISEKFVENIGDPEHADLIKVSQATSMMLADLQKPEMAPEMFVPIEKFATDQSSKTFGNSAFNAYKKLGDKAPILSIENPPAGIALSTGEDLKNLVKASREQFVKRAMEEKNLGREQAEKIAEKFIGATWDVGHINMLRKSGFEAKDIVKETEKIAPFVKHVHLSDNFGMEHTELPMGMGNVPIKEIMEKLGKQGFDAKKIIEAGSWWQHQRTTPFRETLEAFGSPIYGMKTPYWNQSVGFQQDYFGGYGMMLPPGNYEIFGSGFSRLPSELGGQKQGAEGSRMSGKPME